MSARRKAAATAVADLTEGTVLARVEIAAPPERVFRALTTEELTRWWGADDLYRTTKFTIELARGGRWRTEGVGADGSAFHVEGEILEVDPPRKLVQTWKPSWEAGPPTTITYTLDEIASPTDVGRAALPEGVRRSADGGTRVTVRHTGFTNPTACDGHADGWVRVLGWLCGHVAPPPEDRYFLVRLIAPRPTFAQDMTADERAMMEKHGGYWRSKLAEGAAIAFGPVLDPKGAWGLGLVRAADEAAVRAFEAGDPAIAADRGFRYEILPFQRLVH